MEDSTNIESNITEEEPTELKEGKDEPEVTGTLSSLEDMASTFYFP